MTEVNFDNLSNKEIADLYKQSREEAIRQRDKNERMAFAQSESEHDAMVDLGVGEGGYWKDSLGYVHEGVRPKPKQDRYYISAEGYAIDLADGEQPPISQGTTLLDKVTNFVNQNLGDPQVAGLLPEGDHVFTPRTGPIRYLARLQTMNGTSRQ